MIQKSISPDVDHIPEIFTLIRSEKTLIPLHYSDIRANLDMFRIIMEDGHVVAVGWLQRHSPRISEIRSLVVDKKYRGRGCATRIVKDLIKLNKSNRLIAISYNVDFFKKFPGVLPVVRSSRKPLTRTPDGTYCRMCIS